MCFFCICEKHDKEFKKEFLALIKGLDYNLGLIHGDLRVINASIAKLRNSVASFKITSSGGRKVNINPGQSTILTAVPLDAQGNTTVLPVGDVPNWSASDTSKITAVPSADGLSLNVTVNSDGSATPGDVILTITDAQVPTAMGTFTLTIPNPTPNPVASFGVTASTPTSPAGGASAVRGR